MASSSSPARTGSCLCGAIKVHIQGHPVRTNLCHCASCQKSTGVVYSSMAAFKSDDVTYTASDPSLLRTYDDKSPESGGVLQRSFCGRCGSNVRVVSRGRAELTVMPQGIIDGDKDDLTPKFEFFCARRAGWLGDVEGAQTYEGMPTVA
ncbi:hypothetical protein DL764_004606 [Monosporascus ibericus]|uniref:CENP-V/GFA domain-containing protein n=1 Tax=Monosporascus ibericus TaxID=155417 RepID=A0A4Q4TC10_9PEZI|nr:hypothetical protein DL764_004606 [Monosporascus ibericus]